MQLMSYRSNQKKLESEISEMRADLNSHVSSTSGHYGITQPHVTTTPSPNHTATPHHNSITQPHRHTTTASPNHTTTASPNHPALHNSII